jgi:hypothetical protein
MKQGHKENIPYSLQSFILETWGRVRPIRSHSFNENIATEEVPPPLEEATRYLETQKDWMGNYEQWQADGYPVGSGLVERAVAVVINLRMKKRGMRLPASSYHRCRGLTCSTHQC